MIIDLKHLQLTCCTHNGTEPFQNHCRKQTCRLKPGDCRESPRCFHRPVRSSAPTTVSIQETRPSPHAYIHNKHNITKRYITYHTIPYLIAFHSHNAGMTRGQSFFLARWGSHSPSTAGLGSLCRIPATRKILRHRGHCLTANPSQCQVHVHGDE